MNKELIWSRRKKDFKIDWFNGEGGGGQHRNKNACCVRLTDKETGIQTSSQEFKSAKQNLKSAFRKIINKLFELYNEKEQKSRLQAGFGQPRIRTYHQTDDRVTDDETGDQYSFKQTVGKGNIDKIILDRNKKKLLNKKKQ